MSVQPKHGGSQMSASSNLSAIVDPVISLVPQQELREALRHAFLEEWEAVRVIENCFELLPEARLSRDLICTLLGSWKATHLKMLAIYGLSCRLHRMAAGAEPPQRNALYVAAARNAETSYEDLGLDYDARTHTELYEEFAEALVGDDSWQLRKYRLPEAQQFSRWVYRNMVVEDIGDGLLTKDRKSTRLNSSHVEISYAVFCLKKKKTPLRTLATKTNRINCTK